MSCGLNPTENVTATDVMQRALDEFVCSVNGAGTDALYTTIVLGIILFLGIGAIYVFLRWGKP